MKITYPIILFFVLTLSCMSTKPGNDTSNSLKSIDINYEHIKLKDAINIEKSIGSKESADTNTIYTLGKDLYPNRNEYPLASARVFRRNESSCFSLEVDYSFDKRDSSVKAILYEWNSLMYADNEMNYDKENKYSEKEISKKFRNRFEQIKVDISSKIGMPNSENFGSKTNTKSYRDDVHWLDRNGVNIYMFMFGSNYGYGQIRVVVYWE